MFVLTYGILLFLLAVILYPTDVPRSWDPHRSFIDMRRWFFGIFVVLVFVEAFDSYQKNHLDEFSTLYFFLLGLWLAGGILGWISENRRIHNAIAVSVLASQVAWVGYQLRNLERSIS